MQPWLERYLAGEHEGVWDELVALGPIVEPEIRAEAERVAEGTMQRAAAAFTELLLRLECSATRSVSNRNGTPRSRIEFDSCAVVAGGPVPISIAGFWRVVGSIDLAPIEDAEWPEWLPTDPPWQERLDPMVVHPLRDVWFDVDDWLADRAGNLSEVVGPLEVSIAPDRLHKVNISGGPPYAIRLPDASVDAPIRHLEAEPYLIPYLRRAAQRGGFSGVSATEPVTPAWTRVIAELTRDLPRF